MEHSESHAINSETETDNDQHEEHGVGWYHCDDLDSFDQALIQGSSDSVFYFETDHAALKGNTDYQNLIKTLSILQTQRIKAIEDIDRLEKLRSRVRCNPKEIVNKFIKGDFLDIPSRIEVQQVPEIDWSKYSSTKESSESLFGNHATHPTIVLDSQENDDSQREGSAHSSDKNLNKVTVRGRVFDQSKPQTFNQLWTPEEQLRLEELLLEFPPERKENNRWRKIAQALGNRTTKQVCSRVQKYFKKLNKAGLPIPGHQLKTNTMTSTKKKPRRVKHYKARISTFFPTQHLGASLHLDGCDDDESKPKVPALTEEMKANIVKKVIKFKKKDAQLSPFSHPGLQCIVCRETPLNGTCWHCLVCQGVNLCSDCVITQLNAKHMRHPPCHPLEPVTKPTAVHWDPDYMPDSFQSTNYLDPNFVTPNVL